MLGKFLISPQPANGNVISVLGNTQFGITGVPDHIVFRFTDGRSERADGFEHVLVHDGRLKPAECGGPLYDTDGRFYGINIARFSRTSTLAIPAILISKFVEILNFIQVR